MDVETRVVRGRAAVQIAEHAEQENVGLIAMTTHGRSGFRRWVMGSVTDKVVRHTGEPVLVIRPRRPR